MKENLQKILNGIRLGFSLAKTNFKLRNEGSYLGILWYLLEPLAFFVIILLVGGVVNRNPVQFYSLYLFLALIMFNFFMNATSLAAKAIISHSTLIKSMRIDQEALVLSAVFQFIFSHVVEMAIFLGFMAYFGANILGIIFYIPIFLFFILFILGVSFALAAIGVFINDISNIWSVATRLLWFLTPIFYVVPASSVYQNINYLNPMFHFINIAREIIIYGNIPGVTTLGLAIFFSLLSFFVGFFIFRKYKVKFAEHI